ncbi:hypothetical protein CL656_02865 [bacterium]|nr:hypothetical protein [bacterium]
MVKNAQLGSMLSAEQEKSLKQQTIGAVKTDLTDSPELIGKVDKMLSYLSTKTNRDKESVLRTTDNEKMERGMRTVKSKTSSLGDGQDEYEKLSGADSPFTNLVGILSGFAKENFEGDASEAAKKRLFNFVAADIAKAITEHIEDIKKDFNDKVNAINNDDLKTFLQGDFLIGKTEFDHNGKTYSLTRSEEFEKLFSKFKITDTETQAVIEKMAILLDMKDDFNSNNGVIRFNSSEIMTLEERRERYIVEDGVLYDINVKNDLSVEKADVINLQSEEYADLVSDFANGKLSLASNPNLKGFLDDQVDAIRQSQEFKNVINYKFESKDSYTVNKNNFLKKVSDSINALSSATETKDKAAYALICKKFNIKPDEKEAKEELSKKIQDYYLSVVVPYDEEAETDDVQGHLDKFLKKGNKFTTFLFEGSKKEEQNHLISYLEAKQNQIRHKLAKKYADLDLSEPKNFNNFRNELMDEIIAARTEVYQRKEEMMKDNFALKYTKMFFKNKWIQRTMFAGAAFASLPALASIGVAAATGGGVAAATGIWGAANSAYAASTGIIGTTSALGLLGTGGVAGGIAGGILSKLSSFGADKYKKNKLIWGKKRPSAMIGSDLRKSLMSKITYNPNGDFETVIGHAFSETQDLLSDEMMEIKYAKSIPGKIVSENVLIPFMKSKFIKTMLPTFGCTAMLGAGAAALPAAVALGGIMQAKKTLFGGDDQNSSQPIPV